MVFFVVLLFCKIILDNIFPTLVTKFEKVVKKVAHFCNVVCLCM